MTIRGPQAVLVRLDPRALLAPQEQQEAQAPQAVQVRREQLEQPEQLVARGVCFATTPTLGR